jgi:hypothetical protein
MYSGIVARRKSTLAQAEPTPMRNLLALLAAVVLSFSIAGFWRGWYSVETMPAEAGRSAFRVEIDRSKVAGDVADVAGRIIHTLTRQKEETPAPGPEVTP